MGVFKRTESPKEKEKYTAPASAPAAREAAAQPSVVGKTILIQGEVFSDEEVLVEGTIEGKLHIKHRVVVEKSGVVNADIEAREVIVKGTVNGNVNGHYKVEVIPDGVLNGNILSHRVVLADGAIFKGNIDMKLT